MFDKRKAKELVLGSLIADSYCLGSHWIYDEKELKSLPTNWEELNNACSLWHKGKKAGEFTHYGDQLYFLYQYIIENDNFNLEQYIHFWKEKMENYDGYIDGATKTTLENLNANKDIPCGSLSTDISVIGRIAPLLLISKTKNQFFQNVEKFVRATHNSSIVVEGAKFFAKVLVDVLDNIEMMEAIKERKDEFSTTIQKYVNEGLYSIEDETFDAIRKFGPACGIDEAFGGVIHLLGKYTNFKEALIKNAQAGGDNSARAMIVAMFFIARYGLKVIPKNLTKIKVQIDIS
ncbi:MAG: ADP-ribosylglycohydrolase family protein [Arcobacter sp.]|uniref:ADP-ribosylglycohydrolase family protein n=1 Tax=Arcobacter sp. TaxID=1872629 RepID=UPI003B00E478